MPYSARLNPWAVIRLLPNCQRVTIARHRSESDATGYCRILHHLEPQTDLRVVFDPISEEISTQISDRIFSKIRTVTPMKVEVVPHNPTWREAFEAEADLIADLLGENVAAIHHIGSTAIPTIYAKPIIDILVAVRDITQVDDRNLAMESLGYEAMGEFGIPGRRYFRKCVREASPSENRFGTRTHHVHTFEVGSGQIDRHLTFRDYMRTHPDDARQYSELKQKLAQRYPQDIEEYMDGKDKFIKDMDKKAAVWRKSSIGG